MRHSALLGVILFLTLPLKGQNNGKDYSVFVNLATSSSLLGFNGRLYWLRNDTLSLMNRIQQNSFGPTPSPDLYDTSNFKISSCELNDILEKLKCIDSFESHFNFCVMGGLRFHFSYEYNMKKQGVWIGNAYDENVFFFIDIINKYVPVKFKINYDKRELIKEEAMCLKEFFGKKRKRSKK